MFTALKNRGIAVDALNSAGIYTQKQMDEMDERCKRLWNALNEVHAVLSTYVPTIEAMTDDYYSFCGKEWTKEMKKADILNSCDRLNEVRERCHDAMMDRG